MYKKVQSQTKKEESAFQHKCHYNDKVRPPCKSNHIQKKWLHPLSTQASQCEKKLCFLKVSGFKVTLQESTCHSLPSSIGQ